MTKVNLNLAVVETYAIQAFKETCFLLGREFTAVISDPGAFPNFPDQDIVDEGRLRTSQRLEFIRPGEARFSWDVLYAYYVLAGYTLQNGKQQEGRDWVAEAQKRFDFQRTFDTLLELKLKAGA